MSDQNTMDQFMNEVDASMKRVQKGDILDGKVISVNDEEVIVNIGYIADGIIRKEEMSIDKDAMLQDAVKVDDVLKVYVIKTQDDEGNVILSEKRAHQIVVWDELEDAFENKTKLKVTVKEVVKGGVTAYYKTVRCFIPGSLLSYRYVEDMNAYVGKELIVKVEDFDLGKKRVVLSRKAVEVAEREEMKEILWEAIKVGDRRKGVVTKLMKFGAFVDIGGAEGLIHINDMAWHRVKKPSDIVSEGDEVEVDIIKLDRKNQKIGLSLKKVDDNPWHGLADYYHEGDIVEGKVVRLLDFGAFVEIEAGVEGLVHVSEISSERVNRPSDVLEVGQVKEVVILKIDEENQKISLSIKEAEGLEAVEMPVEEEEEQTNTLGDLFGDKLKDLFK